MTLAAVLVVYALLVSGFPPGARDAVAQDQSSATATQTQTPADQGANPAPASPSGHPQNSGPSKPAAKSRRHRKKTSVPDCSTSTAPLDPTASGNATSGNDTASKNTGSADEHSSQRASNQSATKSDTGTPKPCPPPKVVIKDGGSAEPTVQLKENTTAEQASQQLYTTEQLTAAAQENLKKVAGRQLSASQKEMMSQVKEFMEQSSKALAEGDLQRGHNLAMKAQLLSEELVKP
ncbi:MAG: hypothetical protein WBV69_12680 [Candidatus Sulfotelmatobacter sp.]